MENLRVVSYHTEDGARPALVADARGSKLKVMVFDRGGFGLTAKVVPGSYERYMRPLLDNKDRPYPVGRAVRHARRLASKNRYGATKAGRIFIKEAEEEL